MNKSNSSDLYGPDPLLTCSELKNIGIYVVILFIISVISNITLIYILIKHENQLMNKVNIQIFALSILSLIGTLIELPMVGIAAFACRFIFGKYGCIMEGLPMYFVGCSSIYILMFIAYTRYKAVNDPLSANTHTKTKSLVAIGLSLACGAFWSILPLLGWSHYSLEGALISCSVEWNEKNASVLSYNIAITIFVFLVPLIVFIFTSARVFHIMKVSREKFAYLHTCTEARKKINLEIRLAFRSVILITGFLISWTPYAVVCIYRAFLDDTKVSPLGATLPAFFAKSSLAWPALFTLIGNKDIRMKICGYEEIIASKNRSSISSQKTSNNPL